MYLLPLVVQSNLHPLKGVHPLLGSAEPFIAWDLIVIGNVGLSGISRIKALGSVSRDIVERAVCSVLVVHYSGSRN